MYSYRTFRASSIRSGLAILWCDVKRSHENAILEGLQRFCRPLFRRSRNLCN